ncbi:uncharacterized protein LOC126851858 [Cataglyphis hispanica]|uniref:uncharacterized protein LOC126851858 n=1 Tax=Cataglyphis hispanica TaxID=1086592 RepID=UPI0021807F2E|nr:uncharacterized protein LOC126851858 [Cataglyphis hispanica]
MCLNMKAVHFEVLSDYTAEAFLAALRRFTAHRGLFRSLRNDCGTNFVGADAQLHAFFTASYSEQLFNVASTRHRHHITVDLWEAVKSLKLHLYRVLGEATLTFEEISILLAQIVACPNSKPLQTLSDDLEDMTALIPGHFLIGSALNAVPKPS